MAGTRWGNEEDERADALEAAEGRVAALAVRLGLVGRVGGAHSLAER